MSNLELELKGLRATGLTKQEYEAGYTRQDKDGNTVATVQPQIIENVVVNAEGRLVTIYWDRQEALTAPHRYEISWSLNEATWETIGFATANNFTHLAPVNIVEGHPVDTTQFYRVRIVLNNGTLGPWSSIRSVICEPIKQLDLIGDLADMVVNGDAAYTISKTLEDYALAKGVPLTDAFGNWEDLSGATVKVDEGGTGETVKTLSYIMKNVVIADLILGSLIKGSHIESDTIDAQHIKSNAIEAQHISAGSIIARDAIEVGSMPILKDDGLVAHWSLDDGSGLIAADNSGNKNDGTLVGFGPIAEYHFDGDATDETGNYDGTPTDITYVTGKVGQAASFNGTSSYLLLAADGTGKFDKQEFTISTWVYIPELANGLLIWSYDYTSHDPPYYAQHIRTADDGRIRFYFNIDGTIASLLAPTEAALIANTWTHITASFKSGEQKISINNVVVATDSLVGAITYYNQEVWIGRTNYNVTKSILIDDTRFYDYALSEAEIAALYNRPQEPSYWVDGISGRALAFDGKGSYVSLLKEVEGTSLCFSFWFNPPSQDRMLFGSASTAVGLKSWVRKSGSTLLVANKENYEYLEVSSVFIDNELHYYTIVLDSGTVSAYRDGALIGTDTAVNSPYTLLIKRVGTWGSQVIIGLLDEPRIYNRALSADEIKYLYWNPGGNTGRTVINGRQITTGLIRSKNYVPGVSGSKFDLEDGLLETNNGIFRGTFSGVDKDDKSTVENSNIHSPTDGGSVEMRDGRIVFTDDAAFGAAVKSFIEQRLNGDIAIVPDRGVGIGTQDTEGYMLKVQGSAKIDSMPFSYLKRYLGNYLVSTWTARAAAAANSWRSVTWSPDLGLFCAVAYDGTPQVMTSPDGINWTARTAAEANQWMSVTWSTELGIFCAVSSDGTNLVMTSSNGISWTARAAAAQSSWQSVTWSASLEIFCAVSLGGATQVMTSPDGINWTARIDAEANNWVSVTWSPELGIFCAVAYSGTNCVMTSSNGINWTTRAAGTASNYWRSVTWSPELGIFCAVGWGGTNCVMTSPDGITWTARTAAEANDWYSVTWSPGLGLFCAVSSNGTNRLMTSPDGINWTARTAAEANQWMSVTWSTELGIFCAVSWGGTNGVMTSRML